MVHRRTLADTETVLVNPDISFGDIWAANY